MMAFEKPYNIVVFRSHLMFEPDFTRSSRRPVPLVANVVLKNEAA